jgi:hypothetical protein
MLPQKPDAVLVGRRRVGKLSALPPSSAHLVVDIYSGETMSCQKGREAVGQSGVPSHDTK